MLSVKGADHVRRSRHTKSFRWCAASTGIPVFVVEASRLRRGEQELAGRELRRAWLLARWREHLGRTRQVYRK